MIRLTYSAECIKTPIIQGVKIPAHRITNGIPKNAVLVDVEYDPVYQLISYTYDILDNNYDTIVDFVIKTEEISNTQQNLFRK